MLAIASVHAVGRVSDSALASRHTLVVSIISHIPRLPHGVDNTCGLRLVLASSLADCGTGDGCGSSPTRIRNEPRKPEDNLHLSHQGTHKHVPDINVLSCKLPAITKELKAVMLMSPPPPEAATPTDIRPTDEHVLRVLAYATRCTTPLAFLLYWGKFGAYDDVCGPRGDTVSGRRVSRQARMHSREKQQSFLRDGSPSSGRNTLAVG